MTFTSAYYRFRDPFWRVRTGVSRHATADSSRLEGGDTADGLRVGALAGLVAFVPFVLIGLFGWLFFFGVGAPATMGALLVAFLAFVGLYTVGLSALGGVVGIYVKDEL